MKKQDKGNHPARKGKLKNILLKILTLFIIIVLISVGVGIYYAKNFAIGYKYYNSTEVIGVTQQENLLVTTIEDFLSSLEDKGYYIVSSQLDTNLLCKQEIIQKNKQNDTELKNRIIKCLDVDIFMVQLSIEGDNNIYYFKTEKDCNEYVNELNEYIEQKYSTEHVIDDYTKITSDDILEQKKVDVVNQRKEIDAKKKAAEEKRKQQVQVTSRGGTSRTSSYRGSAPMASYTYISSYYGPRNGRTHTGVDFAAPTGTNIYAWKSGKVVQASWSGGYGNFIVIEHNDGTISRYGHLSGYAVSTGATVSKDQTIGYVGSTGNSTGPHLHFEIKVNGQFVNPLNYL